MFSFVNRTTEQWSTTSFTITECAAKETSIDALSTSLFLKNYVDLLYRDRMSHYHTILAGWFHITNCYYNSTAYHLCTTRSTLAYDSKNLCSPLQYNSTMISDPHTYFMRFTMSHLTAASYPTNTCLEFYSGDTVDIEMKDIGSGRINSRDSSNSQFLPYFSCAFEYLASYETYACRSTAPIISLHHSFLM